MAVQARNHYATGEIAKLVSFNRRHIVRIAAEIPGAVFHNGKWRFEKSEKLRIWIRQTDSANRRRGQRPLAVDRPQDGKEKASLTITTEIRRLGDRKAVTIERPIEEWSAGEVVAFLEDMQPIEDALKAARNRYEKIDA